MVKDSAPSAAAVEWIDVNDDSPPRRRKRRSTHHNNNNTTPQRSRRSTEGEVGRFFPKLARILESGESLSSRSPSSKEPRRQRDRSLDRYSPRKEVRRSPIKHRVGGGARRSDTLPRFNPNPSLLSVLSSLTRTSERSSTSSGTTVTQRSFDQGGSKESSGEVRLKTSSETETSSKKESRPPPYHALDFMDSEIATVGCDGRSIYSNASTSSSPQSSHYQPSDAGSSDLPDTPSSQSTYPSPTATRSGSLTGSVAELRRKYDSHHSGSVDLGRSGSHSPEITSRSQVKRVSHRRDDAEEGDSPPESFAPPYSSAREEVHKRTDSHASQHAHEEQRDYRHHTAPSGHHHLVDPYHNPQRSHSASSNGSSDSQRAWAHYLSGVAMQQYQHPSPPAPVAYPLPPQALNGHATDMPHAPDAPNLNQRTLAGYEMLAHELSQPTSSIQPMYRKFEFLNHRILLHMQDELQEMEERLRTLDEIVAQMEPPLPEGLPRQPASRRGDAFQGSEIHHRRTQLLGRIFMKTEQYNRAMTSFAAMSKECAVPETAAVQTYRDWLRLKAPLHEVETKFLDSGEEDLLVLPTRPKTPSSTTSIALNNPLLPLSPILPLLLVGITPTLAGRLLITILFVLAGAVLVATEMPARGAGLAEVKRGWLVVGAGCMLFLTMLVSVSVGE